MSRLIDADALLEKMSTHCDLCQYNDHIHHCRRECDWHEAIDEVEDMDEVESDHVRHGHWAKDGRVYEARFEEMFDSWSCSQCKYCVFGNGYPKWKYCPMCGCRMQKEEVSE